MTTEDKMKALRAGIDEAKQFIDKYGVSPALVYLVDLKDEELIIWVLAIMEWMNEHTATLRLAK